MKLRSEQSFRIEDIVQIECATNKSVPKILIHHHPQSGLEGKFSIEYCVAVALLDGEVSLDQFTDKRALAEDVQHLVTKVKYVHPPELEDKFGFHVPGIVTVRLKNNKMLTSRVESPKGRPENPMTLEELKRKFERCACPVLLMDKMEEVVRLVLNLEKAPDIRGLMEIISGA